MFLSASTPTVADVLNGQRAIIRSMLESSFQEGDEHQLAEAIQLHQLFDFMRNDLADQLHHTIAKVEVEFRANLCFLVKLIDYLKEKNRTLFFKFFDKVWTLLRTHRAISALPQIKEVFPQFAAPGEKRDVLVTLLGVFPDADKEGLTPIFTMNRYSATLVEYTENLIRFSLPFMALEFDNKAPKINYGEISFPREISGWISAINPWSSSPFTFTHCIASAPISPGKLELSGVRSNGEKNWQIFDLTHIGSNKPKYYKYKISPGWSILNEIHSVPDCDCEISSKITSIEVIFSVNAANNIDIQLSFEEEKLPEYFFEEIPLKWGEKTTRELPKDVEMQVIFTTYDDEEIGPVKRDLSHRLLVLQRNGDQVEYQVKFPQEVKIVHPVV